MIKVVDDHHKVLRHWAECRNELAVAPRLLTLDHHTDTSKPFRKFIHRYLKKNNFDFSESVFLDHQSHYLSQIDFHNLTTVDYAIDNLSHDEHVVTAIKTDIISSAFVIAHNAATTDLKTYQEHKIVCSSVPEIRNESGIFKFDYDNVLDSKFLLGCLKQFDNIMDQADETRILEAPFILDIDLDYFNTFASIKPKDYSFFKFLAQKASLITIATEPEYVKVCALDKDLTFDYILNELYLILKI